MYKGTQCRQIYISHILVETLSSFWCWLHFTYEFYRLRIQWIYMGYWILCILVAKLNSKKKKFFNVSCFFLSIQYTLFKRFCYKCCIFQEIKLIGVTILKIKYWGLIVWGSDTVLILLVITKVTHLWFIFYFPDGIMTCNILTHIYFSVKVKDIFVLSCTFYCLIKHHFYYMNITPNYTYTYDCILVKGVN